MGMIKGNMYQACDLLAFPSDSLVFSVILFIYLQHWPIDLYHHVLFWLDFGKFIA